jgi:uncharacterized membrane protein YcaP (DUF421 family)
MDILRPEITVAEKVLRSVVVYLFLLAAFRLAGKRTLGQMTAFDLVVCCSSSATWSRTR